MIARFRCIENLSKCPTRLLLEYLNLITRVSNSGTIFLEAPRYLVG